jgi:hypothetical protein
MYNVYQSTTVLFIVVGQKHSDRIARSITTSVIDLHHSNCIATDCFSSTAIRNRSLLESMQLFVLKSLLRLYGGNRVASQSGSKVNSAKSFGDRILHAIVRHRSSVEVM